MCIGSRYLDDEPSRPFRNAAAAVSRTGGQSYSKRIQAIAQRFHSGVGYFEASIILRTSFQRKWKIRLGDFCKRGKGRLENRISLILVLGTWRMSVDIGDETFPWLGSIYLPQAPIENADPRPIGI